MEDRNASDNNTSEGNITGKPKDFFINKILLQNATLINERQKEKLISGYINKRLTINDINALIIDITKFYVKAGYSTARVKILPDQNFKNETLTLLIIENIIEEIKIGEKEQTFKDKIKIFTAYPFVKGKKLNIRDIEQGVEQSCSERKRGRIPNYNYK